MKTALFYLFPAESVEHFSLYQQRLVCQLAGQHWRTGKKILVNCETQQQAEQLDELMWQLPTEGFIPHNLAGEGSHYGAPVELCWPEKRGQAKRQLVINLQTESVPYLTSFNTIIDFVPYQENLKILARERYKTYRTWGFSLTTNEISNELLNTTIID